MQSGNGSASGTSFGDVNENPEMGFDTNFNFNDMNFYDILNEMSFDFNAYDPSNMSFTGPNCQGPIGTNQVPPNGNNDFMSFTGGHLPNEYEAPLVAPEFQMPGVQGFSAPPPQFAGASGSPQVPSPSLPGPFPTSFVPQGQGSYNFAMGPAANAHPPQQLSQGPIQGFPQDAWVPSNPSSGPRRVALQPLAQPRATCRAATQATTLAANTTSHRVTKTTAKTAAACGRAQQPQRKPRAAKGTTTTTRARASPGAKAAASYQQACNSRELPVVASPLDVRAILRTVGFKGEVRMDLLPRRYTIPAPPAPTSALALSISSPPAPIPTPAPIPVPASASAPTTTATTTSGTTGTTGIPAPQHADRSPQLHHQGGGDDDDDNSTLLEEDLPLLSELLGVEPERVRDMCRGPAHSTPEP